jgi:hypothetical protein
MFSPFAAENTLTLLFYHATSMPEQLKMKVWSQPCLIQQSAAQITKLDIQFDLHSAFNVQLLTRGGRMITMDYRLIEQ